MHIPKRSRGTILATVIFNYLFPELHIYIYYDSYVWSDFKIKFVAKICILRSWQFGSCGIAPCGYNIFSA